MTSRRRFLVESARALAASTVLAAVARGQGQRAAGRVDSTAHLGMDADVIPPVRRAPKPGARPVLSVVERDDLEHHLHCQCGTCTLDIYTCRTTDFACQVSPAMHRDVMALVAGGYTRPEILDAFVDTFGERVLMAPRARGFNLLGYVMPFIALAAGGAVLFALLRTWGARARSHAPVISRADGMSADEHARLEAAIRDDK